MHELLTGILNGSYRALARAISLVENTADGYTEILSQLPVATHPAVIGITGPPGAGKSTIADALIGEMLAENKKVGVLCIDPSSPFNFGALLGDRIRMSRWYNNEKVFIRSLANRGSLGGLHPSIIEITDVMKAFGFDYIIVETVGVGQSEVEIAGLADTTIIVLVPEAGDEVQTMKAGLMEIGDIFVVNKADRPGADIFARNLQQILHPVRHQSSFDVPVVKTVAHNKEGVDEVMKQILLHEKFAKSNDRKYILLAEKAYQIIQKHRMNDVERDVLYHRLKTASDRSDFNFYLFVQQFF